MIAVVFRSLGVGNYHVSYTPLRLVVVKHVGYTSIARSEIFQIDEFCNPFV